MRIKKSEHNSKPSKDILIFIRLANLFPDKADLENLVKSCPVDFLPIKNIFEYHVKVKNHEDVKTVNKDWIRQILKYPSLVEELEIVFKLNLKKILDVDSTRELGLFSSKVKIRLQSILGIRNLFNQIVDVEDEGLVTISSQIQFFPFFDPMAVMRVVDGRLKFQPSKFAEVIEGIEVKRLRRCVICQQIFWANRFDKESCSKKCSNVHQQRIIRANSQKLNEVNERRRRNYAYKKSIKKQKGDEK